MEPGIWSRLPEELLERILALLPLRTIVSLRPTCKHFNSLLFSPSFLSLLHPPPPPSTKSPGPTTHHQSFLLLSHPQFSQRRLPLYDSSTDHWRTLSLPQRVSTSQLLSSSSGLLCFSLFLPTHNPSSLLVFNLLTNSSTTVPSPIHAVSSATLVPIYFAGSSRSTPSPHGYKIFVPASNGVFIYDSWHRIWTRFDSFDPILNQESQQEGVSFNGSLYFATPEPFRVVGFDLETGRWENPAVKLPEVELPEELVFVRLVSSGEKLYLVGGVGRDGISRSLRVWELRGEGESSGRRWEEIGRLPAMMCRKFVAVCFHNYSHVCCFWHEEMVCVGCVTWPELLLYKKSRGTWHWMPRCPLLPEKSSCGFRWFSLVPDLFALV